MSPGGVDLASLRIEGEGGGRDGRRAATPRPPLGPRLFAAAVSVLALAVAATFVWPLLRPVRAVRTAPVRLLDGRPTGPADVGGAAARGGGTGAGRSRSGSTTVSGSSATATTEAVGWIEPDPFPTIVRPLVQGHLEALLVLEGDRVVAGETVIARLASAGLWAARDRARAQVHEAEAEVRHLAAEQELARARLEQNAAARTQLRTARTQEAALHTRVRTARRALDRARAVTTGAAAAVEAQERLAQAGSTYPVALERARAEAEAARAGQEAAAEELAGLEDELEARTALVALSEELVEDPVDLRGAAEVVRARAAKAAAALEAARTELAIAERELGWATVLAPVDGVVLRLEAEPGDMVGHGEKGIVALYDPDSLRARIDVPFDSLAGIHPGQAVEIRTEALGDTVVRGVVQRLQRESDLLKNTLQVKVELLDPPELLRPETLCRARFLVSAPWARSGGSGEDGQAAAEQGSGTGNDPDTAAVADDDPGGEARSPLSPASPVFAVPAAAVRDGQVFVLDPTRGTARQVAVEVVGTTADGGRAVRGELSPTQRVILDPVEHGERVREVNR